MKKTLLVIASAAVGAALAYLFDPDRGRSRRAQLSDQAMSQIRDAEGVGTVEDRLEVASSVG